MESCVLYGKCPYLLCPGCRANTPPPFTCDEVSYDVIHAKAPGRNQSQVERIRASVSSDAPSHRAV